MKGELYKRLAYLDKINYARAIVAFPKEEGTLGQEATQIFTSALLGCETQNYAASMNAICLLRGWVENEHSDTLPQSVINHLLETVFHHPELTAHFIILVNDIPRRNWIFCSLLKLMKDHQDLVKDSIKSNHPIWDYLTKQIELDIGSKGDPSKIEYNDRKESFLIEVFPFAWKTTATELLRMKTLVKSTGEFLLSIHSPAADSLLSSLFLVFPSIIMPMIDGSCERLSQNALVSLVKWSKFQTLKGNMEQMLRKILLVQMDFVGETARKENITSILDVIRFLRPSKQV